MAHISNDFIWTVLIVKEINYFVFLYAWHVLKFIKLNL